MAVIDLQHCSMAVAAALLTLIVFPQLQSLLVRYVPWLSLNAEYHEPHKGGGDNKPLDGHDIFPEPENEQAVQIESEFPADWWSNASIYQLERRAIFSKGWHFMTHISQFRKPGDYVTLSVGGYSIFLTLGKDQKLRGFHNVCRHRAYEITRKECGSTLMFGCRYHGWSYNTEGTLVKAPEFDGVDGFKKTENGLWEIDVFVAKSGAVWICLDTEREESNSGACVDDARLQMWGFKTASKVFEHKIEGNFNWKLASGHEFLNLRDIVEDRSLLGKLAALFSRADTDCLQLSCSASIYSIGRGASLITVNLVPQSPGITLVSVTLYAQGSRASFKKGFISSKIEQIIRSEISGLEKLQLKTHEGTPILIRDQLYAHAQLHERLKSHARLERRECREIHPASRQSSHAGPHDSADDDFCRKLDRSAGRGKISLPSNDGLDW